MGDSFNQADVKAIKKAVLETLSFILLHYQMEGVMLDGTVTIGSPFMGGSLDKMTHEQAQIFFDVVNMMVRRAYGGGRDYSPEGFLCRNIHFAETSQTAAAAMACWAVGLHKTSTKVDFLAINKSNPPVGWWLRIDLAAAVDGEVFTVLHNHEQMTF